MIGRTVEHLDRRIDDFEDSASHANVNGCKVRVRLPFDLVQKRMNRIEDNRIPGLLLSMGVEKEHVRS